MPDTPEAALYHAQRARPPIRRARLQAYKAQILREARDEIRPGCRECACDDVLDVLAQAAQEKADEPA